MTEELVNKDLIHLALMIILMRRFAGPAGHETASLGSGMVRRMSTPTTDRIRDEPAATTAIINYPGDWVSEKSDAFDTPDFQAPRYPPAGPVRRDDPPAVTASVSPGLNRKPRPIQGASNFGSLDKSSAGVHSVIFRFSPPEAR